MSRLPALRRDQLPNDGKQLYDRFEEVAPHAFGTNGELFTYKDHKGAYIGPYPFFLAEPKTGNMLMNYLTELGKHELPSDARETAILAVGGHYQAEYELYAHVAVATKKGLLSHEQCETIRQDKKPSDLNENCGVAYDVAKYLSSQKGPLPQHLWDASIRAFGKDGTVTLMHFVAFYAYTCVVLNFGDFPVPEDEPGKKRST